MNRTSVGSVGVVLSLTLWASVAGAHNRALPQKPHPTAASRRAQQPAASARIEVLVLEATMGSGGIAAAIAHLPQLRQPPFASYTQIDLVSRTVLPLGSTASSAPLPQNGSAAITSTGRSANGRYSVTVNFSGATQHSQIEFVAAPGEPFFTVRSSRPDRALIVGFIVRQ